MGKRGVTAATDLTSGHQLSSEERWISSMRLSILGGRRSPYSAETASSGERPQLGGPPRGGQRAAGVRGLTAAKWELNKANAN